MGVFLSPGGDSGSLWLSCIKRCWHRVVEQCRRFSSSPRRLSAADGYAWL